MEIINMNGRIYDPIIGQFMQPDNNVATPEDYIGYDRYSYCLNNPFKYTDPSGEWLLTATAASIYPPLAIPAFIFEYCTPWGYDLQKYLEPIAVKIQLPFGSDQRGIGFQVSLGAPKMLPVNVRVNFGAGYYFKNYDLPAGWQANYGWKAGVGDLFTIGETYYDSPGSKYDQKTAFVELGIPGFNLKYENDYIFPGIGDEQDRYRTAAVELNIYGFTLGVNLMTGDPGNKFDESRYIVYNKKSGQSYYTKNKDVNNGCDPDELRAGVMYIGYGPLRVGWNSEAIRDFWQNHVVHGLGGLPWYKVMDIPDKPFWQLGTSGGYLW
jgi:hypothetical protein